MVGNHGHAHPAPCICSHCVCSVFVCNDQGGSVVGNHGHANPAPCICPHCVCCVFACNAHFSQFDKAEATADIR